MTVQVVKWGNGQGVRLPKAVLQSAGIRLNEELTLVVEGEKIILDKAFKHRSLEERAAKYCGELGPYEEFDWGEPVGREVW